MSASFFSDRRTYPHGVAFHLHHDFVGRRFAADESPQTGNPLLTDGRHLNGVAVVHDGHGRYDAVKGKVGVVDGRIGSVKDLLHREMNGLSSAARR